MVHENLNGRVAGITGGGGEQGPVSRTPEIRLSELTLNGVTTVVSPLGTDGISRSLENLLFKCRAREHYGRPGRELCRSRAIAR